MQQLKVAVCHQSAYNLFLITSASLEGRSVEDALTAIFLGAESNSTFRSVRISFPSSITARHIQAIGQTIDDFILSRPWWKPVREPFAWEHKPSEIILERSDPTREAYFRHLAAMHFPSPDVCGISNILIGRSSCIHPGWFSVLGIFQKQHNSNPTAIFAVFFPDYEKKRNSKSAINAWISKEDCPSSHVNRWTCAFLPTTNCTLPKAITDCANASCIKSHTANITILFNGEEAINDNYAHASHTPGVSPDAPIALAVRPFDWKNVSWTSHIPSMEKVTFLYQFLLRPTSLYRSKIYELLHKFRRLYALADLDAVTPCVAAQLRRGDRLIPHHLDPIEWCYNASHHLLCNGKHCSEEFGCGASGGVAFSAINLSHVVDKVPVLVGPSVKNVVVASDDPDWVHSQIALMKEEAPGWNFYTLPHPQLPEDMKQVDEKTKQRMEYQYLRSEGGTESGAFLFASIELATHCSGFVGHMKSGMAAMFYHSMCSSHAGLIGVCPPFYDFRDGLWLN